MTPEAARVLDLVDPAGATWSDRIALAWARRRMVATARRRGIAVDLADPRVVAFLESHVAIAGATRVAAVGWSDAAAWLSHGVAAATAPDAAEVLDVAARIALAPPLSDPPPRPLEVLDLVTTAPAHAGPTAARAAA